MAFFAGRAFQVSSVVGRRLLPSVLADRVGRGQAVGGPRLNSRRGLGNAPVEMPERKRKLQSQRKQREPRAMFDVRPEPLHADRRPHRRRPRHPGRRDVIILHHRDRRRVSTVLDPRVGRIWKGCVIHATPGDLNCDQRPSRSQVAANAPSKSSKPIRPANSGSTPTPLTTLASRIFTPIQPSP